jgi:hypothetical protein
VGVARVGAWARSHAPISVAARESVLGPSRFHEGRTALG